jgi:hypothetical protein
METSSDLFGKRTLSLPAFPAEPQPNAPPCNQIIIIIIITISTS